MLGLILRLWLTIILFFLGRLFGVRRGAGRFGGQRDDPGGGGRPGGAPGGSRGSGRSGRPAGIPPIDRSDVVDVPFTEIPPPSDAARGAAGGS
jgi:hypothetical protein